MDTNIVQTVFNSLDNDTTEIDKIRTEYEALDSKIKANRYSQEALAKEIYPKRDALREKLQNESARAIEKARGFVQKYREDADRLNDLDPSALTDDIKLFTAGVPLLHRDIAAILERNKNNRTMTQLALRYAQEHNIDMKGTFYIGGEAEKQNADNLDSIITYYGKWIDKADAHKTLRKFFSLPDQ